MEEEELISRFTIKSELLADLEPSGFSYGNNKAEEEKAEDIKPVDDWAKRTRRLPVS